MNSIPDIEQYVFEGCKAAVLAVDASAVCKESFEEPEGTMPFVHIIEDRNVVYEPTAGSGNLENHAHLRYSVNVYTGDAQDKKARAKTIMTAVAGYFDKLGFVRTRCQPMPGGTGGYRMRACYEAVIDKDKKLYAPMRHDERAL